MKIVTSYLWVIDNIENQTEHFTNDWICNLILGLLWLCRVTADKPGMWSAFPFAHADDKPDLCRSCCKRLINSAAEKLRWSCCCTSRDFFFLSENLKGLALQINTPGMLVYLGLVYIYLRVQKGDPLGALKAARVEDYEFFP